MRALEAIFTVSLFLKSHSYFAEPAPSLNIHIRFRFRSPQSPLSPQLFAQLWNPSASRGLSDNEKAAEIAEGDQAFDLCVELSGSLSGLQTAIDNTSKKSLGRITTNMTNSFYIPESFCSSTLPMKHSILTCVLVLTVSVTVK